MKQNEPSIVEMNYAIGVFDGKSFAMSHITDYTADDAPKMKYHYSWDALMRVVEKIAKIVAMTDGLNIPQNDYELAAFAILRRPLYTPLSIIHNDVYQFITWYNQQKQRNEQ